MFLEQHVLVNLPQVPEDVTDQTTLPSRTPQYIEPWGLYSFFQKINLLWHIYKLIYTFIA